MAKAESRPSAGAADQRAEVAAEPADREGYEAVEGQRQAEREEREGQLARGEAGQRPDARRTEA